MRVEELLAGVKAELAIKVFGNDQKVLNDIATKIQQNISDIDGAKQLSLESQLGQSQIKIEPDYLALARYGINVDEVMSVIRNGIGRRRSYRKN